MTYKETLEYLYDKLPAFHRIGVKALKPKLHNITLLCESLNNPQNNFKTIHVAGTNGKGSSSHLLASIAFEHGYKVGLYTSPHLKDFRERFKVNGIDAPEDYVIEFVKKNSAIIESLRPSFFELTVALAFKYFSDEQVDIAIIEVGLGGRFDSTNIIIPEISLITNIGFDHQNILGNTLSEIAFQKAGIIKKGVPVVISEKVIETTSVFLEEAKKKNAKIIFAEEILIISNLKEISNLLTIEFANLLTIESPLIGDYQIANIRGVIATIIELNNNGYNISNDEIIRGIRNVIQNTKLKGRWQIINNKPLTICDTGHNLHAWAITTKKIKCIEKNKLHLVMGFVNDKDTDGIFELFESNISYYFCKFDSFRSLTLSQLKELAKKHNIIDARYFENVNDGILEASKNADEKDMIFIGGSTFLVAEIKNL